MIIAVWVLMELNAFRICTKIASWNMTKFYKIIFCLFSNTLRKLEINDYVLLFFKKWNMYYKKNIILTD